MAPDVFNHVDSKSESWHRANKIREVFMDYESSAPIPTFFRNGKSCFYSSALIYNYKNYLKPVWRVKMVIIGTRNRIVSFESGALPACPFPAGTLIVRRAVYLFVHCAHFIALANPFHYTCKWRKNFIKINLDKSRFC